LPFLDDMCIWSQLNDDMLWNDFAILRISVTSIGRSCHWIWYQH
jgi:hypothetical protein